MKLYIAEKSAQAADIAKILGGGKRENGHILLKTGDVVTWAVGHMLDQMEPKEYHAEWGPWRWDTLPMVPEKWGNKPVPEKQDQLRVIKQLLGKATSVVIATDAGREGELIARELLDFYGYRGKVERLWLSALTEADIRRALSKLLPGATKEPLYRAALARQHADWLYLSLSRAASLSLGFNAPIGRVQTPTLAMVVKRDLEIEAFNAKPYYELEAVVNTANGHTLTLTHSPKEEQRIYDLKQAKALMAKAEKATGPLAVTHKAGSDGAPLPFSLSTLQREADRVLGLGAAETLKLAQELYEAKVITYPRTDCSHLSSGLKNDVAPTLTALTGISTLAPSVKTLQSMGVVLRDSLFDDSKLTDHHGIIPTTAPKPLAGVQAKLYELIAIRFMQALAPDRLFNATRVEMDANGVPFSVSGRVISSPGWSAIRCS